MYGAGRVKFCYVTIELAQQFVQSPGACNIQLKFILLNMTLNCIVLYCRFIVIIIIIDLFKLTNLQIIPYKNIQYKIAK